MNGVLRRPTVGRFLAPSNPLDKRGEEAGWKATLGEGNGEALKRGENSLGGEAETTPKEGGYDLGEGEGMTLSKEGIMIWGRGVRYDGAGVLPMHGVSSRGWMGCWPVVGWGMGWRHRTRGVK